MGQRECRFDNIKALLIFLVVFAHMIEAFCQSFAGDVVYKLIFSFHMPVFLFVSGYFARYHPKQLFARMFPLYVIFQCLRFLLDFLLGSIAAGEITPVSFQLFTPRFTLWYLVAIMAYQLLLPVFDTKNVRHRAAFLVLAVVLGVLMGFNPNLGNFMAFSRIVVFLPFFLLGYYEKDARILTRFGQTAHRKEAKLLTGLLAGTAAVLIAIFHKQINDKWFLGSKSYGEEGGVWYIRLILYLCAFVWLLFLLVWIPEKRIPVVGKIGQNTLSVYLLHAPALVILEALPTDRLIHQSLAGVCLLSLAVTFLFSRDWFEKKIRKIKIT